MNYLHWRAFLGWVMAV